MRKFKTGATRDTAINKLDYEGFLSPIVLKRFAEYMHNHRHLADGSVRDSDNWQLGLPIAQCMKSLLRHVVSLWLGWRGERTLNQDELCAILFNTQALLLEDIRYYERGKDE